jgi:streptogramin lyase
MNRRDFILSAAAANLALRVPEPGVATEGTVHLLSLPPNSGPVTVTVGRDGAVWFTAGQGNYIGRFDSDGTGLRQFPLPNANSAPRIIAMGADGNVWFSEHGAGRRTDGISHSNSRQPAARHRAGRGWEHLVR